MIAGHLGLVFMLTGIAGALAGFVLGRAMAPDRRWARVLRRLSEISAGSRPGPGATLGSWPRAPDYPPPVSVKPARTPPGQSKVAHKPTPPPVREIREGDVPPTAES